MLRVRNTSYFHESDEPNATQIESYRNATQIIRPLLAEYPIIDAFVVYP